MPTCWYNSPRVAKQTRQDNGAEGVSIPDAPITVGIHDGILIIRINVTLNSISGVAVTKHLRHILAYKPRFSINSQGSISPQMGIPAHFATVQT